MPQFTTNLGALLQADHWATALITDEVATLELFKSDLNPNVSTPLTAYVAAICNFTGYAAKPLIEVLPPALDPLGGASFILPTVQWQVGLSTPVVSNLVGGWFIRLQTPLVSTQQVFMAGTFPEPIPMQVTGQVLPMNLKLVFGQS